MNLDEDFKQEFQANCLFSYGDNLNGYSLFDFINLED